MMRRTAMLFLFTLISTTTVLADSSPLPWTQLSLSTCNVDRYHRDHPGVDGRGVVIAVLDTGVDMGVLGLTHTPLGEVKVIDVQDFTGQGDVELQKIECDPESGKLMHYAEDGAPEEYALAKVREHEPGTRYWFGVVEESRFANSDVRDINDNGREDDAFAILVVVPPGGGDDQAIVYVDTDADRDWSDEQPLRNYHLNYDAFQFAREKKERQIAPLTCGLNVSLADKKVVIHFDDGGHGTHVAGIAAGYRINGQRDFHGVAPGAKIISLKIGNNTLAGGATTTASKKKAFEYAARYARENNVPVVCNLSYGIGSEQEGQSDIDVLVDRLCKTTGNLIVFTSAGNEGPGLSTVGTPAAGSAVISVAALLAADSARDVMGVDIKAPQVAVFSSRGGELAKPTIAVPGYATSTVPRWNRRGDFWRGTSMASPYAAGMGAVMICSAQERYPDVQHRTSWVKEALQQSGSPVYEYTSLDYGAGIPDMAKAAQAYQQLVAGLRDDVLYDYRIDTISPLVAGGKGPAAFWRSMYYPQDQPQVFEVKPRFAPTVDAEAVASFSKQYKLVSDADWLRPKQQQVYFRSEQKASVRVEYDANRLRRPGLHVGTVHGVAEGQVGFRLVNTVVVPHVFGPENDYRVNLRDQRVEGWRVQRHFIAVPPGATAMHLSLRVPEGQFSDLSVREIFRPDGSPLGNRDFRLDTRNHKMEGQWTIAEALEPGVWELCAQSSRPDETSYYDLEIRFSGVHARPPVVRSWKHKEGARPSGEVAFTQMFQDAVPIDVGGVIEGYEIGFDKTLTPKDDLASRQITFNPEISAVRIEVEFSEEDFAHFTDVAVNGYGAGGTALAKDGMSYRKTTMTLSNPEASADSVTCNFELRAAFADDNPAIEARVAVTLTYLYAKSVGVHVDKTGTLYPGVARTLRFELDGTPPAPPEGAATVGYLQVSNHGSGEHLLKVPIRK